MLTGKRCRLRRPGCGRSGSYDCTGFFSSRHRANNEHDDLLHSPLSPGSFFRDMPCLQIVKCVLDDCFEVYSVALYFSPKVILLTILWQVCEGPSSQT